MNKSSRDRRLEFSLLLHCSVMNDCPEPSDFRFRLLTKKCQYCQTWKLDSTFQVLNSWSIFTCTEEKYKRINPFTPFNEIPSEPLNCYCRQLTALPAVYTAQLNHWIVEKQRLGISIQLFKSDMYGLTQSSNI